jgi:hypothetical protein
MGVSVWSDWLEYQRLDQRYFCLRVLTTDRAEWTTAQIIEAYRGQSKVEAALRDLKASHARYPSAVSLDRPETACSTLLSV